jgi:isoamylase
MASRVLPGIPSPLGATWDGNGVNFALYSEAATGVELCLFDDSGRQRESVPFTEITGHVWHAYLPDVRPGQLYGYRVHGPYEPAAGQRFNPAKLLIDPYAKAIAGKLNWQAPVFGYQRGNKDSDLSRDDNDDAWGMPKCVVVDPSFDWQGDAPPAIPWHKTVIYETHVKGLTIRHPELEAKVRGSYAGLASPPIVDYLKNLGITAVELMPVHDFLGTKSLIDRGLSNYWGYNTTNFFSPSAKYSSSGDRGGQVKEFKTMVKMLHSAGIEVILDVVYNHTSEGDELGPTLSFRGIDNLTYYRLEPGRERHYVDYTGTGNSLNVPHPQVLKLVMDSLRYWVLEMHVDGFRFDLASTLAREMNDVDRLSAFFAVVHHDPVISQVKLIAEPWDLGEGGYQLGNFPVLWTEWNGKYRDSVRRFWKADKGLLAELGYRLTGSSDLYQQNGRSPYASINFITAHDGFTLHDLVSYNRKHNKANGEGNRDGTNDNFSWNCGVEGPTDNLDIIELRERQKRNFLATLFLSQGVPMLFGGDELGRTQRGNNNAYCQDNDVSWYDWNLNDKKRALLEYTKRLIQIRRAHPILRRSKFFQGRPVLGSGIKDIMWLRPDGQEMTDEDWKSSRVHCISVFLAGTVPGEANEKGEPMADDDLLLLLNPDNKEVDFTGPVLEQVAQWEVILDTDTSEVKPPKRVLRGGEKLKVGGRSTLFLRKIETQK